MKGRVLIIAGSDSGGGAGIQADIKAVGAMGAFAATAVTAVTVQNTLGVSAVHDIPASIVRQQIIAVLSDIGADVIKIGMIGRREVGDAILEALVEFPNIPMVLDPVLVATSGDRLGDADLVGQLRTDFVPRAAIVTPNLIELEALVPAMPGDPVAKAHRLLSAGAGAVLVKGGHGEGAVLKDHLVEPDRLLTFENRRLDTAHTHGTGCTLASALAAGLAQGQERSVATARAIQYVHEAIRTAPGFGHGHGPLNHLVGSWEPR